MVPRFHAVLRTVALVALAACAPDQAPPTAPSAPSLAVTDAPARRHLVVFDGRGAPSDFEARVAALDGSVVARLDQVGLASVAGLSESGVAALARVPGVQMVDVEPEATLAEPTAVGDADIAGDGAMSPAAPNTAFFFPRQWHHQVIEAPAAWAAGKLGSASTKVFILDTGIDYTHPDLVGRVDLSRSRSFVPGDDAFLAAHADPHFNTAHRVADLHFHGTHVSATVSSNARAAAGVTSGVTLVGVKVLGRNGRSAGSSVFQGLVYAADNGADVINMSLGGGFFRDGNGASVAAVNRVVNYVRRSGALLVVAAGNDRLDLQHMNRYSDGTTNAANYYATYCDAPNVICVSATGPTGGPVNGPWVNIDAMAPYTNYGNKISVAAPGGAFRPVTAACSRFVAAGPLRICRTGTFVVGASGTSMAAPHVAGLAALLIDEVGRGNPAQLRAALQQSADDRGAVGNDPFYGRGRINVRSALGL